LLAVNHLFIYDTTEFANLPHSSKFSPIITTLVSSANIMGIAKVFIIGGISLA
jgi:hypothetical protein